MAKEAPSQAQAPQDPKATGQKSSLLSKKMIVIGIPVFLLQIAVIYFLMTKFMAAAPSGHAVTTGKQESRESDKTGHEGGEGASSEEHDDGGSGDEGESGDDNVFVVKDLIINPSGTNGTRFLLTTIGFRTTSAASKSNLEKREVEVRDALNTILTGKGLEELSNVEGRDSLRSEIARTVGQLVKSGKLKNVYFSKFVIQ